MSTRRASWSLAELTELDLRLREEIVLEASDLKPGVTLPRDEVVRYWLHEQKRRDPAPARTAERLVVAERIFRGLVFGFLFVSGAGAAAGLLRYEGDRLINVSLFLGTLVFGQAGLLLLMAVSRLLLRRSAHTLYQTVLFHFFEAKGRSSGELEPLRSAPVWSARAFASMQLGAAGFNLGALAATGVLGLTRDLAFGWATTLDVGAETMARITSALARPWGGAYVPTPDQIAYSRIVLKDGLQQVDSRAAAAWWPFLLLCVLVYGLLPRLLLSLGGEFRLRWRLRQVRLSDPACERLYMRLTRTSLQFRAGDVAGDAAGIPVAVVREPVRPPGAVKVMVPPELMSTASGLAEAVGHLLQVPVDSVLEGRDLPDTLPAGGVVLLQELWQPPLEENLHRLREWREQLPANTDITLLGTGEPEEGRLFTRPAPTDIQVWQHALSRLADPHVQLIPWPG